MLATSDGQEILRHLGSGISKLSRRSNFKLAESGQGQMGGEQQGLPGSDRRVSGGGLRSCRRRFYIVVYVSGQVDKWQP